MEAEIKTREQIYGREAAGAEVLRRATAVCCCLGPDQLH